MSNITLKCIHRSDEKCRDCSDDLTFAEAMALDPSEVEMLDNVPANAPRWKLLASCLDGFTMSWFRTARFRRASPHRSRVQEMAEAESISYSRDVPLIQQTEAHYVRAIRAVCEYLRRVNNSYARDDPLLHHPQRPRDPRHYPAQGKLPYTSRRL